VSEELNLGHPKGVEILLGLLHFIRSTLGAHGHAKAETEAKESSLKRGAIHASSVALDLQNG
jgi:hypothetical protein